MTCPLVILAGGQSQRMGFNKALARLDGRPLIEHVLDRVSGQTGPIFISANGDWAQAYGLPVIGDIKAGHPGPLGGILSALEALPQIAPTATRLLTVTVDCPFLPDDYVARMAAAPDNRLAHAACNGRDHPAFGLWPRALAASLKTSLQDPENRRMMRFMQRHDALRIDFPMRSSGAGPVDPFHNINSPADLAEAEAILLATSGAGRTF